MARSLHGAPRARSLLVLAVLAAPVACADLIGLHPPKSEEDGSGGMGGDDGGSGAGSNIGGERSGGGSGPDAGGGTSSGSTSGDSGGSGGSGGSGDGGGDSGGGGSGGGSGGEPSIIEPTLITSGPEGFWEIGDVAEQGSTANVQVDTTETFQTWHGFGGAFTERGWTALQALSAQDQELAMRLLFSKTEGAGFTWGRLPIGASSYAEVDYTHCDEPCTAANLTTSFALERDDTRLIPFAQAALDVNPDIKFWGIPWTPPPWMKDNDSYYKGSMRNEPEILEAYAQYFVEWIEAYEAAGIVIDHVQPQAEPDFLSDFPSCAWGDSNETAGSAFLGTFVETYLLPTLASAALDTDVWYGALANFGVFAGYWANLSTAGRQQVKGVALEWGALSHLSTVRLNAPNLLVMQSEHECGNYPWNTTPAGSKESANASTFWNAEAPNNYNYALETWGLLKDWIAEPSEGVNIYHAAHMVLDTEGVGLDEVRRWPQNSLLAVDLAGGSFEPTPAYYVFRHLSQYVDEGAVLVRAQGGDAMAFENPDGSVVVVLHNDTQNPAATTLSIDGTLLEFSIPATGWATVNWQN